MLTIGDKPEGGLVEAMTLIVPKKKKKKCHIVSKPISRWMLVFNTKLPKMFSFFSPISLVIFYFLKLSNGIKAKILSSKLVSISFTPHLI
jgi:hypothetical protein